MEYRQDLERLNVVIRRLPRMAELAVQSKMQLNPRAEMLIEFILMISTNHQHIQVRQRNRFCFQGFFFFSILTIASCFPFLQIITT